MNYFADATDRTWASADPPAEARRALDGFLGDVLTSENLVVLAGLGTSRAIGRPDGTHPAPTMHDLWMAVRDCNPVLLDTIIERSHHPAAQENIEVLLSRAQMLLSLAPDEDLVTFINNAESKIAASCRFVTADTDLSIHATFLQKVARRSTRLPRMKLFTTNYDVCFERAANRANFIVIDGFSHTLPQVFDGAAFSVDFVRRGQHNELPDYIPNVLHLYKLHGSVDWEDNDGRVTKRERPDRPRIIYPRESKFASSYDPPFLELMSSFQTAIRQPNTGLVIVGFGFNDAHITHPLNAALRSNVSLKALIVDPTLETGCDSKPILGEVRSLIRAGDFRLAMLAATFEELVPVLPDLVAVTDEERHRERLRGAVKTQSVQLERKIGRQV